jgi:hypothetical protein
VRLWRTTSPPFTTPKGLAEPPPDLPNIPPHPKKSANQMSMISSERVPSPSPSPTVATHSEKPIARDGDATAISDVSNIRKFLLLVAFSIAQFVDVMNTSSLFPGIPAISEDLHFTTSEAVWLISAYQLTFASFLLLVRWLSLSDATRVLTTHILFRVED